MKIYCQLLFIFYCLAVTHLQSWAKIHFFCQFFGDFPVVSWQIYPLILLDLSTL